jgi:hypothetical protein
MDSSDLVKRVLKYVAEGLVVVLAARYIPSKDLNWTEIATIAVVAAVTFAALDMYSPTVAIGSRLGAGLVIGSHLVGPPSMASGAGMAAAAMAPLGL